MKQLLLASVFMLPSLALAQQGSQNWYFAENNQICESIQGQCFPMRQYWASEFDAQVVPQPGDVQVGNWTCRMSAEAIYDCYEAAMEALSPDPTSATIPAPHTEAPHTHAPGTQPHQHIGHTEPLTPEQLQQQQLQTAQGIPPSAGEPLDEGIPPEVLEEQQIAQEELQATDAPMDDDGPDDEMMLAQMPNPIWNYGEGGKICHINGNCYNTVHRAQDKYQPDPTGRNQEIDLYGTKCVFVTEGTADQAFVECYDLPPQQQQ